MIYINTLREGDNISETYFCKDKVVAQSKAGKTYYSLKLQDRTGIVDAKVWDLSNAIEHFESMDYIRITGQVTSFNNSLQINVRQARKAAEGTYDIADYMPVSPYNIDEMYKDLLALIDTVKDPNLNGILRAFFVEDADFIKAFKKSSAAKAMHHSFIGGLLQHTLSVAQISDYVAGHYSIINRDLLVTAAICHDIGKVNELSSFPENDYTDVGNLVGHIVMGAMMVRGKAAKIEGMSVDTLNKLVHCILAHHGKLEYGSPEKPKIIEALALSFADDMDAKLQAFTEAVEGDQSGELWLPYNKMFESYIRKTN
ncbi:MAG: HD domain-containing protein [Eubacterium sp.]|jgi:3'-5' exoribonuclease|nr:HD domain-containing protein [Eubacterium sp.]